MTYYMICKVDDEGNISSPHYNKIYTEIEGCQTITKRFRLMENHFPGRSSSRKIVKFDNINNKLEIIN